MRILYCIYQLGVGGGVERVLTSKANYLIEQGHDVRILTCRPSHQAPVYGLDPRVRIDELDIDYAKDFHNPLFKRIINTISKMWRHYKLVQEFLRKNPVDIVVTTHAYEMAFLPFIKDGSRKVLELHSSTMMYEMQRRERDSFSTRLLVKSLVWRDCIVNSLFDAVGCLTQEDFEQRGKPKNMRVIPNPLPFTTDTPSDCSNKIVLALGRHSEEKNFNALVDIWNMLYKDHPEWKLKIVGGGYLKSQLKNKVEQLGLQHTVLIEDESKDPRPYYQEASIFAMTSNFEGLPMTLIEAQTFGLPIISYACPCGPRDVIIDGTGYLVTPDDKQTFAQRLSEVMSDNTLRKDMGQNARQASSRYGITTIMSQWLDLFTQLIKKQ